MLIHLTGSSDAQYHVMWIIMFNALDEFGLKESNDMARAQDQGTTPPVTMTRQETEAVDGIKTQVMDEALHGALRIAALVSFRPPDSFSLLISC